MPCPMKDKRLRSLTSESKKWRISNGVGTLSIAMNFIIAYKIINLCWTGWIVRSCLPFWIYELQQDLVRIFYERATLRPMYYLNLLDVSV